MINRKDYTTQEVLPNNMKNIFARALVLAIVLMSLPLYQALAQTDAWKTQYQQVEAGIRQFQVDTLHKYLITDYGAKQKANAKSNQKAINKAISECARQGGGTVIVPAGTWNTGGITLQSGVNLRLETGAVLLFSPDKSLYPLVLTRWEGQDLMNYQPFIYARDAHNVAITGQGTIDGGAGKDNWWPMCGSDRFGWKEGIPSQKDGDREMLSKMAENEVAVEDRVFGAGHTLRPQLVNFVDCDGVLVEGVTLLRSPFWVLHPLRCKNVVVRRVTFWNEGPNGDGCDPESCDGVLIEDCLFHTGDDCIAIKSGRNADGRRWNMPSQNIIVRRCVMEDGHGGVVIGSEVSGGCRNVFVEDCTMDSKDLDRVIRIKTNTCRGGITENVFVRNVEVGQCREAVLKINLDYERRETARRGFVPTVRNVWLENVNCQKSRYGVLIIGLDSTLQVNNINLNNCRFNGVERGNSITGQTRDVRFNNLYINGKKTAFALPGCEDHYSLWMTKSEMKRVPKSFMLDFAKKPRWSYVMGIELESMLDTYLRYGGDDIRDYIQQYTDTMIATNGEIRNYKFADLNIDNIRTGRFVLRTQQLWQEDKKQVAIDRLVEQLDSMPRTNHGIWWHKKIYPQQVWLDGIYMGLPFYTMNAMLNLKGKARLKVLDDAVDQLTKTAELTYDQRTGLHRHAYDATHSIFWADKQTGLSQHTWGRAQGWMMMAMVELLDVMPEDYARRDEVVRLLQRVAEAVVRHQDPETGLWYQVMDVVDSRNYLEATCSSMFAYSLLKAVRKGWIPSSFQAAGIKAYRGIVDRFIHVNSDGTISLSDCCSVAGLGPENNKRRDGTFEYYISEPIRDNDAKGVGPFIWASLEMEQMGYTVSSFPITVDEIDTRTGTDKSAMPSASKFGKDTENYGQTLPAVLQPNGMTFWTPQTRASERKGVAPYYYADRKLQGFRASHWLVGGATQDYGSFTISAVSRKVCTPTHLATPFSHDIEKATPAYYAVTLPKENIHAEMTGLSRSVILRFTSQDQNRMYVVLNCNSDEDMATVECQDMYVLASNPVHRIYQGWGKEAGFSGHIVMTYDKQPVEVETFHDTDPQTGLPVKGVILGFDMKAGEILQVKAATSFVSTTNARINLDNEIPHWNFDAVREQLTLIWEQQLNKIRVETADRDAIRKFYGSMYRCSFLPRTISDVDGSYPSFAASNDSPMRVMRDERIHYSDFSLWDTFRAMHPLYNILSPSKSADMMQSLVDMYSQGGWMPIFPCWNSYTSAMIGDHVASVMADAYIKGIRDFDVEKAYEGLRQNAFDSPSENDYQDGKGRRALRSYLKYGYVPLEDSVPDAFHQREQVSRTLEYAYDDFALSVLAGALGRVDDSKVLLKRSQNYRNVFDPTTGWVQGRYADGTFLKDDNAFVKTSFITEGAPCHYSWFVPHDPEGLMECMGGNERYLQKLDSMFSEQNYWHGNEPCHQVAYMYNFAGEPQKTQRAVSEIMKTEYQETPSGLAGNDDAGQMSAWYIFSAMGFYPVCPGTTRYELSRPSFDRVVINLENGNRFCIEAENTPLNDAPSDDASLDDVPLNGVQVKSIITRNGQPYNKTYIDHKDIVSGALFNFY